MICESNIFDGPTLTALLVVLADHPFVFSLIEQEYADELLRLGLFSLNDFSVTPHALEWVACQQ